MAVKSLAQSSLSKPQRHRSMLAGYETNMFHHLETIRLASSAASVTFTNLGQYSDFQHLQLRWTARSTSAAANTGEMLMRLNGDTGSNYAKHYLRGNGSIVNSSAVANNNYMGIGYHPYDGRPADIFSSGVTDFLDAFNTSKYTTSRSLTGSVSGSGENFLILFSGLWQNTNAVDSITILPEADNWKAGCRFSLYGLKARA